MEQRRITTPIKNARIRRLMQAPIMIEVAESDLNASCKPNNVTRQKLHASMSEPPTQPNNPLHGITLERILTELVERHGWESMGDHIPIRCFQFDPSIKSSLTFLRKTPWARKRVEDWFLSELP
jgi:hypothetical protein